VPKNQATQRDALGVILMFFYGVPAVAGFAYISYLLFVVMFLGRGTCQASLCR
jgi:hypothetical protein